MQNRGEQANKTVVANALDSQIRKPQPRVPQSPFHAEQRCSAASVVDTDIKGTEETRTSSAATTGSSKLLPRSQHEDGNSGGVPMVQSNLASTPRAPGASAPSRQGPKLRTAAASKELGAAALPMEPNEGRQNKRMIQRTVGKSLEEQVLVSAAPPPSNEGPAAVARPSEALSQSPRSAMVSRDAAESLLSAMMPDRAPRILSKAPVINFPCPTQNTSRDASLPSQRRRVGPSHGLVQPVGLRPPKEDHQLHDMVRDDMHPTPRKATAVGPRSLSTSPGGQQSIREAHQSRAIINDADDLTSRKSTTVRYQSLSLGPVGQPRVPRTEGLVIQRQEPTPVARVSGRIGGAPHLRARIGPSVTGNGDPSNLNMLRRDVPGCQLRGGGVSRPDVRFRSPNVPFQSRNMSFQGPTRGMAGMTTTSIPSHMSSLPDSTLRRNVHPSPFGNQSTYPPIHHHPNQPIATQIGNEQTRPTERNKSSYPSPSKESSRINPPRKFIEPDLIKIYPIESGPTEPGPIESDPMKPDPIESNPPNHDPPTREPSEKDPSEKWPSEHEPLEHNPLDKEISEHEPLEHEPLGKGFVGKDQPKVESSQDSPQVHGLAQSEHPESDQNPVNNDVEQGSAHSYHSDQDNHPWASNPQNFDYMHHSDGSDEFKKAAALGAGVATAIGVGEMLSPSSSDSEDLERMHTLSGNEDTQDDPFAFRDSDQRISASAADFDFDQADANDMIVEDDSGEHQDDDKESLQSSQQDGIDAEKFLDAESETHSESSLDNAKDTFMQDDQEATDEEFCSEQEAENSLDHRKDSLSSEERQLPTDEPDDLLANPGDLDDYRENNEIYDDEIHDLLADERNDEGLGDDSWDLNDEYGDRDADKDFEDQQSIDGFEDSHIINIIDHQNEEQDERDNDENGQHDIDEGHLEDYDNGLEEHSHNSDMEAIDISEIENYSEGELEDYHNYSQEDNENNDQADNYEDDQGNDLDDDYGNDYNDVEADASEDGYANTYGDDQACDVNDDQVNYFEDYQANDNDNDQASLYQEDQVLDQDMGQIDGYGDDQTGPGEGDPLRDYD